MRQIILSLLGVVIMVLAVLMARNLMSEDESPGTSYSAKSVKVYTTDVSNDNISVEVLLNGRLEAVNKIDIFAEVQGIFHSGRSFRPGTYYKKGDLLIAIDNSQEMASLKAQRAGLVNQIVQFLPDIKFDFPEEYEKWSDYVSDFDLEASTPSLPEFSSEREKFFVSGKNISTTYYNIKNMEARLAKYRIYAPFSGVLTESLVTPGALIRAGQKLGTLMGQSVFELALPIREEYADMVSIGTYIKVTADESGRELKGKVVRVNPAVDPSSQTITAYVQVSGKGLKEGMFFTAELPLEPIPNAMEIDRKLLVQNEFVYGVEDSGLVRYDVTPEHYYKETVVVTGLESGQKILKKMIPAAREGKKVEVVSE